ncbi:uncharacterized protein K452DRAFT_348969 [Aplosporella prunicola CBS 121167]|uniref:BD-FAE-like domain-containing protein n=1 Tax=Aplosporella prunicola CBS 121167 TaxID=1176127 RepID=A0A6A6BRE0_9PEZI|nr:uncharacterized protein K452DRAFT_348969 [Aplosporella prunicola CBS 121167]KAF2145387.1 hypothetical protein K452DRAFT_348969 [Aplosporella prunicola CBS 121167]
MAATPAAADTTTMYPLHIASVAYDAASRLNTLDICLPRPVEQSAPSAVWVIYIHGGAWRDPLITSASFTPTLTHLLQHPVHSALIAGTASVNYRLSAYSTHGTHPSAPGDFARNASHPAHVSDVRAALRWLRGKYGVGVHRRFVLVGHSCGATLGAQVVFDDEEEEEGDEVGRPVALVGVAGIYDLLGLVHRHEGVPAYREFVEAAFGAEEGAWREASPVEMAGTGSPLRVVVLAHKLQGGHDELWERGVEVARAVGVALERVVT